MLEALGNLLYCGNLVFIVTLGKTDVDKINVADAIKFHLRISTVQMQRKTTALHLLLLNRSIFFFVEFGARLEPTKLNARTLIL